MLKKEQFLPGITTTNDNQSGSDWKMKVQEIKEFGLKRAALFPTCLQGQERQEMYQLLENSGVKEIPFVHIRNDMPPKELDYLIDRFNAKVFNIHTNRQYPFKHDLSQYKDKLFLENTFPWDEKETGDFAGLCLDFSHLHDAKLLRQVDYENNLKIAKKYPIGCNHISAIGNELLFLNGPAGEKPYYSRHLFTELSQFNYLKEYPEELFSDYIAIEVENSLKEQLKAIDYICETLNN